jgi:DNA-binding transcriptional ArsR family regulator
MSAEAVNHVEPVLERAVVVLRAMAYGHRLHILMLLRDGEKSPAELGEAIPADATSIAHHLRFLKDARLVRRQRRGRNVFYALPNDAIRQLVADVLRYSGNSV